MRIHPSVRDKTPLEIQFINLYYFNYSANRVLKRLDTPATIIIHNSINYPDCYVSVIGYTPISDDLKESCMKQYSKCVKSDKLIILKVKNWIEVLKPYL